MHSIFIDGQAGTTGLELHGRLLARQDIEVIEIETDRRKDTAARQAIIKQADVVVLCLPDDAALESFSLGRSEGVRFLDASTAHRTDPDWVYGLPELKSQQREAIAQARWVTNPGCYPTGFLLALHPLISCGIVDPGALISISALSGYSGGGRTLIEKHEARSSSNLTEPWHARPYALTLAHKHVPEMTAYAGLKNAPIFLPTVGNFHQGMLVSIPIFAAQCLKATSADEIQDILANRYRDEPCINVAPVNHVDGLDEGFMDPQAANHTNRVDLFVFGNKQQMVIVARLDNLGKGAAGAAVQNLNLMLQVPELTGLTL